jgi:hypothetical protein
VTSLGDEPAQFFLDYNYELDSSSIWREHVGDPGNDPNDAIPKHKEMEFHQFKHTITPRAEIGVVKDTWISIALPIVVNQARELKVAGGADRAGLSTLQDGFLPTEGYDANDPNTPPAGDMLFKGVNRHGLDQIYLGLNVAPMSQQRDDTKPTWKLGAELRLAIGGVMSFSANNPSGNDAVGRGLHELRLWTSIDKRYHWTEGYFGVYYQVPLTTKSGSLYEEDLGFGVTNSRAPQQGGVWFGLETYLLDDKLTGNRISIDLGAKIDAHFEGREYTELWEMIAFSGDSGNSRLPPQLVLDSKPDQDGLQALSHPGITNVENYLETAGSVAVRAVLGPHVRLGATFDLKWQTDHVITFADAGVDFNTCSGSNGPAGVKCETDENDVVNPGTREVNPLASPKIDQVGHRYHSEDNLGFIIGLEGQFLF